MKWTCCISFGHIDKAHYQLEYTLTCPVHCKINQPAERAYYPVAIGIAVVAKGIDPDRQFPLITSSLDNISSTTTYCSASIDGKSSLVLCTALTLGSVEKPPFVIAG